MDDQRIKQDEEWPLPKFSFEADFGNEFKVVFQEISGLHSATADIEYRHGNEPPLANVKMPGLGKYGNITMKKGIIVNDDQFLKWYEAVKMHTIESRVIIIKLLDENGKVSQQWQLANAWPVKISAADLKSESTELAIESIEIAHEGVSIHNS